jgi:trehalose/maltose transport system substrate-binding protein
LVVRQTNDIGDQPGSQTSAGWNRRDLLKLTASFVGGISSLALIWRRKQATAQDATPETPATPGTPAPGTGATIVLPPNLRTDLGGVEIIVVLSPEGPDADWEQVACDRFGQATGIAVTRQAGPVRAADRLVAYQSIFTLHSRDMDVAMIDVTWPGRLSQSIHDLKTAMASQGYQYSPAIVQNNTVTVALASQRSPGNKVYRERLAAIPWIGDAGLLYFRTDLLEKYGYSHPPGNWTELETMANAIQAGEGASNPDFQGYVWEGAPFEGLTCAALELQYANGGGTIIDDEGNVTLNNPNAIAAFERARSWVGTISPADVVDFDEEEARFVWQAGNAAFMRSWFYAYDLGQAVDSPIKGKFDLTLMPTFENSGVGRTGTLGGWQIMVSRYSRQMDAAVEFAKYITSKELQKSAAIELGRLPTIPELYDDSDVLAAYPVFARLHDLFVNGVVARPSTVTASLYDDISDAYSTSINQILSGTINASTALADLESQLNEILTDLPSVPIPTPTRTPTPEATPSSH